MAKSSLSGNTIYLRLFSTKECDAIRPGSNCFISMIYNFRRIAQWVLAFRYSHNLFHPNNTPTWQFSSYQ